MRNERSLSERLATDLTAVVWPDPAEIRSRARRRTRRTVLVVPVMVALAGVMVWSGAGALWQAAQPADRYPDQWPAPAATIPLRAPAPPTASPETTGRSAGLDQIIQLNALLQPSDVDSSYRQNSNSQYRYEPGERLTWWFDLPGCPDYDQLGVPAWRDYLYRVGYELTRAANPEQAILTEAGRYPGHDAARVVDDVRRIVVACASYTIPDSGESSTTHPTNTRTTFERLDNDFAGESSVLVRRVAVRVDAATGREFGEPVVTLFAVAQVADLVTVVSRHNGTVEQMTDLAKRAVKRACTAAKPRC